MDRLFTVMRPSPDLPGGEGWPPFDGAEAPLAGAGAEDDPLPEVLGLALTAPPEEAAGGLLEVSLLEEELPEGVLLTEIGPLPEVDEPLLVGAGAPALLALETIADA